MIIKALLAITVTTAAATSAYAVDSYTIEDTVGQAAVSKSAQQVDIISIRSGMAAADALSILGKDYGGEDKIDRFNMKIGTRQVQSQQFDVYYEGGDILKAGKAEVYLTSPVSGNRVFAANRIVNFKVENGLPTVDAIKAQLIQKYGPPSVVNPEPFKKGNEAMFWYLGGKGECTEKYEICTTAYDGGPSGGAGGVHGGYNISKTADYERAAKFGADVVVSARIQTAYGYPDGVRSLQVTFVDLNLRARSARADFDLLMRKQAEFDAKSVAMPKL
jgi:hypothetical protein